jgi:hypothetical protein
MVFSVIIIGNAQISLNYRLGLLIALRQRRQQDLLQVVEGLFIQNRGNLILEEAAAELGGLLRPDDVAAGHFLEVGQLILAGFLSWSPGAAADVGWEGISSTSTTCRPPQPNRERARIKKTTALHGIHIPLFWCRVGSVSGFGGLSAEKIEFRVPRRFPVSSFRFLVSGFRFLEKNLLVGQASRPAQVSPKEQQLSVFSAHGSRLTAFG